MNNGAIFAQSGCSESSPSSGFLRTYAVNDSANGDQTIATPHKALFICAIKHSGEPLARISAQTLVEKMALASILRVALSQLEEELGAAIPLAIAQDQVSSIRKAA